MNCAMLSDVIQFTSSFRLKSYSWSISDTGQWTMPWSTSLKWKLAHFKQRSNSNIIERMRAPVREAFSYGIRHWIRHIHCDSMSYDQIRVKPWETIPRIIPRIPQYGVWYSAEYMHWNAKKISCKSLQKSIEAMVMKGKRLPQITLSLFD